MLVAGLATSGMVIMLGDIAMDNPHPSSYSESLRRRSRDLTGVGSNKTLELKIKSVVLVKAEWSATDKREPAA